MRYQGPIYRPPSEADSLLIQATVGCPHNRCTFCMVYKNTKFKVRPTQEILEDLAEARRRFGNRIPTLFFPAGNTIAMPAAALAEICRFSRELFPHLTRLTVYGSSQYICRKGLKNMRLLAAAGLTRIHVGVESGDDEILRRVQKGATAEEHIRAGGILKEAGIDMSAYLVLGLGGRERTGSHARESARVINEIQPEFLRLRTFVPKINTPLLEEVLAGRFVMLSPHEVLRETRALLEAIEARTCVVSDHYTNYVNVAGRLPEDKEAMLRTIDQALERDEAGFRPFFIGTQ
ncbi:MAG: radical SAM protein [Deltaproteobacteria bacterium]|nr:radical SAM protein [Deltaproteobacteria bacterium]